KNTRKDKEKNIIEEKNNIKTETSEEDKHEKVKEKVLSEGKPGTLVKTFEVTKENGKEVDRELKDEEIKTASENRVVAIGTKEPEPPKQDLVTLGSKTETKSSSNKSSETPKESKTDHSSKESETKSAESSEEVMYMNATAYSANCNGCSEDTAKGINLNDNPDLKVVAVDPDVIPLGTKVWVEGYGNAVAGDTGGSIKGNRIDVHVPTRSDASQYGWKKVKVKILE